jgi:transcriptional regulator with XRE-family HTH domain
MPAVSTVDAYKAELAAVLQRFGANVRRVRVAKDPPCSQERLSYTTRLHRTEIGRIEQGTVEPRLTTLMILAEGLDVTVEELLRDLAVPSERKPAANGGGWR